MRGKILKDAVGAGAKVELVSAKVKVRNVSGLLKRSLARKTKSYQSGAVAVAMVGPRSSFKMKKIKDKATGKVTRVKVETGFGKRVRKGNKEIYATPSKYSHLVQGGTKRSRAFPFLGQASAEAGERLTAVVAEGIEAAGNGG